MEDAASTWDTRAELDGHDTRTVTDNKEKLAPLMVMMDLPLCPSQLVPLLVLAEVLDDELVQPAM